MNKTNTTNCTRCGKPRIISKTWTESRETRVGVATVSYSSSVCPDPECQKIVEASINREREVHAEALRVKEEQMIRRGYTPRPKAK